MTGGTDLFHKALAVVDMRGMVSVVSPVVLNTLCLPLDPDDDKEWDRWQCDFNFRSWTYDSTVLNLKLADAEADLDTFFETEAFEIEDLSIKTEDNGGDPEAFDEVNYKMKIGVLPY